MKNTWFNILIVIINIAVFILLIRSCNINKETISMYYHLEDSLNRTIDKQGREISKINILESSRKKDFLKLKSQDSTITKLQEAVKKYKGKLISATVSSSSTTSEGGEVTTINHRDTVIKDSLIFIYPEYTTSWENKWEKGNITANKDSILRQIKITNEYTFTQGYEKESFWKKRVPVITMTNENPNTVTKELRTYRVKESKKRFVLSVGVSHGYNEKLNRTTVMAVNLGYKLTEF